MVEEMVRLRTLLDENGIPWADKSERHTYPKELGFDDFFIDRTHFVAAIGQRYTAVERMEKRKVLLN